MAKAYFRKKMYLLYEIHEILTFSFFDFITSPFETVEIDSCVTSLLISEFQFETDEFDLVVTSLLIAEFQFEAV